MALLVLGALALTGLVTADQAFAGFSNGAVITVWAMFILSEGLTRTGIADIIGRQVMRLGGRREITLIFVIMVTGAVLSAFMNNIGVAALMLPVVVEVALEAGHEVPAGRVRGDHGYPGQLQDVVDVFHGTRVADPYRWLEDASQEPVQKWMTSQHQFTRAYLDTDASLAEINPFLVTGDDKVYALDAKMNFDDNALFRHPKIAEYRSAAQKAADAAEAAAGGRRGPPGRRRGDHRRPRPPPASLGAPPRLLPTGTSGLPQMAARPEAAPR